MISLLRSTRVLPPKFDAQQVSIPANIAEGAGRHSQKEFAYFLSDAQGSASELRTELIIAHRLGYLDEATFSRLISELERIGRLITGLSRHVTTPKPIQTKPK